MITKASRLAMAATASLTLLAACIALTLNGAGALGIDSLL